METKRTITYTQLVAETEKDFQELKKVLEEEDALRHIRFNKKEEYNPFHDERSLLLNDPTLMPSEIDSLYEAEKSLKEMEYYRDCLWKKYYRTKKNQKFLTGLYFLVGKCCKILRKENDMVLNKAAERYRKKQDALEK